MMCLRTHSQVGSDEWNKEAACSCDNCRKHQTIKPHVQALIERIKGCEFTQGEALRLIAEIQARRR